MEQNKATGEMGKNEKEETFGLGDAFAFACQRCGKCCQNRGDLIINPRDIFRLARFFGRSMEYIVDKYCDFTIGATSNVPIVRLKTVGKRNACVFLDNKKCFVHKSKPFICALFPLGRDIPRTDGEIGEGEAPAPAYILQPVKCGDSSQLNTVEEWLVDYDVHEEEEFFRLWMRAFRAVMEFMGSVDEKEIGREQMGAIWQVVFVYLYANYDVSLDFMTQFTGNTEGLNKHFAEIARVLGPAEPSEPSEPTDSLPPLV